MGPQHHVVKSEPRETEEHGELLDIRHRPFKLTDDLPLRMRVLDMCRAFQISRSEFYRRLHAGKFDRFALDPSVVGQAWSGEQVASYLKGQRMFGRKVR